jgi:hypothetical protein
MSNKNFNLDHFLVQLETDEEMAMYELSDPKRDTSKRFRSCPRCGSKEWQQIYPDQYGVIKCCNECETIGQ